jgi:hypothetical protein
VADNDVLTAKMHAKDLKEVMGVAPPEWLTCKCRQNSLRCIEHQFNFPKEYRPMPFG